jgi:phenylpropionate dioxygenase-like ring-hydroxylating dioxygenase large terminal subunit
MLAVRAGERMDHAPHIPEIDFGTYPMRVSTERYASPAYNEAERERLWMRVWQVAGRADDLPEAGDWMEFRLFDQSYVLVRGKDGVIRGFVNACRHRGNAFCEGESGHAARFTCPYHKWSYGLDGKLLAVAKPDFEGSVEEFVGSKDELGLVEIPVECFAGFIFLNPDRNAAPLADFLGEAKDMLAAYRMEEWTAVGMNVREHIVCNWKVVMDAFEEAYHVQAVHPELVPMIDLKRERCGFFGWHAATTVPFGAPSEGEPDIEREVRAISDLPIPNFPGLADVLPHFDGLVAARRRQDGTLNLDDGASPRSLLQQAVRETLTAQGLDVSGLTDNQMSDYQFWHVFPNIYMQTRAGDATVIIARPDVSGDPNRCTWHVANYLWVKPDERAAQRSTPTDIPVGEHFPYFLALEQDYQQMEKQQRGLRNNALEYLALTRQEPKIAHFHANLDRWVGRAG